MKNRIVKSMKETGKELGAVAYLSEIFLGIYLLFYGIAFFIGKLITNKD